MKVTPKACILLILAGNAAVVFNAYIIAGTLITIGTIVAAAGMVNGWMHRC
jgi:hypothetical protein